MNDCKASNADPRSRQATLFLYLLPTPHLHSGPSVQGFGFSSGGKGLQDKYSNALADSRWDWRNYSRRVWLAMLIAIAAVGGILLL